MCRASAVLRNVAPVECVIYAVKRCVCQVNLVRHSIIRSRNLILRSLTNFVATIASEGCMTGSKLGKNVSIDK